MTFEELQQELEIIRRDFERIFPPDLPCDDLDEVGYLAAETYKRHYRQRCVGRIMAARLFFAYTGDEWDEESQECTGMEMLMSRIFEAGIKTGLLRAGIAHRIADGLSDIDALDEIKDWA